MTLYLFLFYSFLGIAAVSATGILITKNVFYGALMLLTCLLAVAGIYVLAFAEFIAVTQILIYAGGVLVVIIFGIMLTSKIAGKPLLVKNNKWGAGLLTGSALMILLIHSLRTEITEEKTDVAASYVTNAIPAIGMDLMSTYVLPFEVAGVLLLVALVGAAVMASYNKNKN